MQAANAEVEQRVRTVEAPEAQSKESSIAAEPKEAASCCAAPSSWLRGRRAWLITGAVAVPLALYAGWDWLAATGLATVLVAAAPCLLMCALGLCVRHDQKGSQPSLAETRRTYGVNPAQRPGEGP